MYAIINKRTKKWLYGTDYRYSPNHQRTSHERVLVFEDFESAKAEFIVRKCGKDYDIVPIAVFEKGEKKHDER